jgi:hypothetical protein
MADHALLAPSGMNTTMRCSGSIQMARLYPEDNDSQDAREGVASHWAGQELLGGQMVDVGLVAPNDVVLDIDMIEGAEMYQTAVRALVPAPAGHIEQRVDCRNVHPYMWGTPDFWHYDPIQRTLYVFDYKYGRRFVEVFENWQLIAYAAGIIWELNLDDINLTVHFCIVQPRSYHRDGAVRTWRVRGSDLRPYVNRLASGAEAAVRHDGSFNDTAVCTVNRGGVYRTGRRAGPALQRSAMGAVDLAEAPVPFDLPPAAVGVELRMIQHAMLMLKARADGLEEQAKSTMMAGVDVPHFRLERPPGREKWQKPVSEVLALGSMLGLNLAKPPEAITPTQARKMGLPAELTATYAVRSAGELTLVPDDGSKARKVFTVGA